MINALCPINVHTYTYIQNVNSEIFKLPIKNTDIASIFFNRNFNYDEFKMLDLNVNVLK